MDLSLPHLFQYATQERIRELHWELLEHPSYSLDLAPSDFHPFGPLKKPHWWQSFRDDEEVETEVRNWLRQQLKDFNATGFDAMVKRWDKCVNVDEGYVEK
jgi:hypothetical protein